MSTPSIPTPVEARASLNRLIDSHFGNSGEQPRVSIPPNPARDDDLRLHTFIDWAEGLQNELAALKQGASAKPRPHLPAELKLDETATLGQAIYRHGEFLAPVGPGGFELRAAWRQVDGWELTAYHAGEDLTVKLAWPPEWLASPEEWVMKGRGFKIVTPGTRGALS